MTAPGATLEGPGRAHRRLRPRRCGGAWMGPPSSGPLARLRAAQLADGAAGPALAGAGVAGRSIADTDLVRRTPRGDPLSAGERTVRVLDGAAPSAGRRWGGLLGRALRRHVGRSLSGRRRAGVRHGIRPGSVGNGRRLGGLGRRRFGTGQRPTRRPGRACGREGQEQPQGVPWWLGQWLSRESTAMHRWDRITVAAGAGPNLRSHRSRCARSRHCRSARSLPPRARHRRRPWRAATGRSSSAPAMSEEHVCLGAFWGERRRWQSGHGMVDGPMGWSADRSGQLTAAPFVGSNP